jgi:putative endonuclease
MSHGLSLGKHGEDLAANYLKSRGYRIVQRNYRCPLGEIDLIAENKGLIFVEVKTRKSLRFGQPFEAVGLAKQEKLRKLASYYLKCSHKEDYPCRFDVISIFIDEKQKIHIEHIKDAF